MNLTLWETLIIHWVIHEHEVSPAFLGLTELQNYLGFGLIVRQFKTQILANKTAKWVTAVWVTPLNIFKDILGYFQPPSWRQNWMFFQGDLGTPPSILVVNKLFLSQTMTFFFLHTNHNQVVFVCKPKQSINTVLWQERKDKCKHTWLTFNLAIGFRHPLRKVMMIIEYSDLYKPNN